MKKTSKRLIRDYSKYVDTDLQYYGLLYKNGRARIDVKRMQKMMYLPDEMLTGMNEPRKTVYFIPARIHSHDYMCNIFRSAIDHQKYFWEEEFKRAVEGIKTPHQVGEAARHGYFMDTGILEPDECETYGNWEKLKRISSYGLAIYSLYAQFIHQFAAAIESVTLKVMVLNGYDNETFNRNYFNGFLKGKADVKIESLENYPIYDRLYLVWNFLKHNSISTYEKLKKKYPEMLVEDSPYSNGEPALNYVIISKDYIQDLLSNLHLFFDEFCLKAFNENPLEASWNSDDHINFLVNDYIELQTNPLGLPDCL